MAEHQSERAGAAGDGAPGVHALAALAVLCGGGLMALEICGARLIEPYMGNSIYVWGSIIGVFMIALTVGYFTGGRLADRNPRLSTLGAIVIAAGLCCFAVPLVGADVCRWLTGGGRAGAALSVPLRALCASLILYLLPSVLLGIVSPYVLRLAARQIAKVGSLAGSLYAASSLGSILGTFAASFVLPEFVGAQKTVWGVGVLLVATGAAAVIADRRRAGAGAGGVGGATMALALAVAAGGAAGSVAAGAWEPAMPPRVATYFSKYRPGVTTDAEYARLAGDPAAVPYPDVFEVRESAYHLITIVEGDDTLAPVDAPRPAIYMLFNNQMESGVVVERPSRTDNGAEPVGGRRLVRVEELARPVKPTRTACGYVNMLHLGMVAAGEVPRRVLVIGCGGGVGPLMMRDWFPGRIERIDVVDIDPAVFELAEKYFGFPYRKTDDPVIRAHVDDGRLFLQNRPDETWDYIVMDAYTSGGRIPKHLVTKEFFDLARARLAPEGLFLANIISGVEPPAPGTGARDLSRLYRAVHKTVAATFSVDEGGQVMAFPRSNRAAAAENIIVVAFPPGRERLDRAALDRRWREGKAGRFAHLPLDGPIGRMRLTAPDYADVPLLTDDFCPTDSMTGF